MDKTLNSQNYQPSFRVVQDAFTEIREMVSMQMRGSALALVQGLFTEEVESLCGKAFSRKSDELCHRGGSDPGSVILDGLRMGVKKPRIRKDGQEVELVSYQALQQYDLLCDRVMKHMIAGVSTREYDGLLGELEGGLGLKHSAVSNAFKRGSKQALEEINGRDLSSHEWVALMIDGIGFAERLVIAAMGITNKGEKLILGLKEGSSENSEVCKDLLQSLIARGLKHESPFLFVLDGSKALKKAVRLVFGESFPIQRCVRHKERNIIEYLPWQYHAEFHRRWKKLHGCSDYDIALREYHALRHWLGQLNHEALASLDEADEETLTVIKLKTPGMLRKTLLSTNPLESAFSKVRKKSSRVTNWKSGADQVSRWAAASLQEAEKKFRLIRGFREIPVFMAELKKINLPNQAKVA